MRMIRDKVPPATVVIARGPTVLIPVCGMPLLKRTLVTLHKLGVEKVFVLTSGYLEAMRKAVADCSSVGLPIELIDTGERFHLPAMPDGRLLVLEGNYIVEERILRLLWEEEGLAVAMDSHPEKTYIGAAICEPSILPLVLEDCWPNNWFQMTGERQPRVINIAELEAYQPEIRRSRKPYWFRVDSMDDAKRAKSQLIASAQKGTLDWWAWYINRPIENWLMHYLADWPITPNQMSLVANVTAYVVALLWASGHLWPWALLAVLVSILDGLDGKLARVKGLASKLGTLEHSFDVLWEQTWYLALAWASHTIEKSVAPLILGFVLLLFDTFNRHIHMQFRQTTGCSLAEYSTLDQSFRWIDGRRNTYLPYILVGAALGKPSLSLTAMLIHAGLTAIVYSVQAIRHLRI